MGRVRIFAGPNGSGKTTLNTQLKGDFNLGYYLNADDLFEKVEQEKFIDFNSYNLAPSPDQLKNFVLQHGLYSKLPSGLSFKLGRYKGRILWTCEYIRDCNPDRLFAFFYIKYKEHIFI